MRKMVSFEVFLAKGEAKLPKNSKVKADQIRTLDKSRLIKFIGTLKENQIEQIDKAAKIHLALF